MNRQTALAVLLACGAISAAQAADPPANPPPAPTDAGASKPTLSKEDANVSYAGDYFRFNVKVPGFVELGKTDAVTAPKDSCFRVSNDPASEGTGKLSGSFVDSKDWNWWNPFKGLVLMKCVDLPTDSKTPTAEAKTAATGAQAGAGALPRADVQYTIDKASFMSYDRERSGWTYGALITPFKYYPGQKQLGSNASITAYLGYRVHDRQGVSDVFAVSVGPTTTSVNTQGASTNQTGATVAVAWLSEIKNSFVIGLILGRDYFSDGSGVQLSGATWIGVNFGLKAN